ncbi:MAG: beta strand repeat-containing protein [Elusimicrobiota bacterium]
MDQLKAAAARLLLAGALLASAGIASAATYYVATTGSDSNPGTSAAPFLTIQQGVNAAAAGDTVVVENGTYMYSGGSGGVQVAINSAGTASSPITLKAQNPGQAFLNGNNNTGGYAVEFGGSSAYWILSGLDIGHYSAIGVISNSGGGSHLQILGNTIHNIGNLSDSSDYGIVGLYSDTGAAYWTINGNTFYGVGRTNTFSGNHDHSLYFQGNNFQITNNVFYNSTNGSHIQVDADAGGALNTTIANNTFYGFDGGGYNHIMLWGVLTNFVAENNIFFNTTSDAFSTYSASVSGTCAIKNNIAYSANGSIGLIDSLPSGCAQSGNQVNVNPLLVAPASLNFNLTSASPAIGAGIALASVPLDFNGVSRGSRNDVGAFEYGGGGAASPPTIAASAASGTVGAAFSYKIPASDTPTSFSAAGLPAGLSVNTASGLISGTPAAAGTSNVTMGATNAGGTGTGPLTLTIAAAKTTTAPTLAITAPAAGAAVSGTITISGTAADGVALSSVAVSIDGGAYVLAKGLTAWTFSLNTAALNNSDHGITAMAWNSSGNSASVASWVAVSNAAAVAPAVTSALTASGTAGTAFSYQIVATGSPASYSAAGLPAGLAVNAASGLISGTPASAGTTNVTLGATNAAGTGTAVLVLTVAAAKTTAPPTLAIAAPLAGATVSGTITVSGTAADSVALSSVAVSIDGGAYVLAKGLTAWTFSLNTAALNNSDHGITAKAWDSSGNSASVASWVAVSNAAAVSPAITSALTASGTAGASFSYQITSTDSPASYSAAGLPAGLSLNAASGLISGTPASAGTTNVTLGATNAAGTGTAVLVLTVAAAKTTAPPTLAIKSPAAGASVSGTITISGTAADSVALSSVAVSIDGGAYVLAKGLTAWTFSLNTAALTNSDHSVTAKAWDSSSNSASVASWVAVSNAAAVAPAVTSALTAAGTAGTAFSYQIAATGSPTSYSAAGLPAGLSVNAASGLISGTPASAGTTNVVLGATNAAGTGTKVLVMTIAAAKTTAPPTLAIKSPAAGAAVSGTITISGTAADSVALSSVAVSIDGGAYVLAKGLTAWTFSLNTAVLSNSDHSVTAKAWDSSRNSASVASWVAVSNAAAAAPAVAAPSAPVITSALTASGTAGAAFSYQIASTAGPTSFTATGLPAGLSVNNSNGLISGTPTAAGTSRVAIAATNAAGTGSATLVLTIGGKPHH